MSLLELFKRPGASGFGFASTADDVTQGLNLQGRTMLVTGCNSGIGYETVRVLAKRGARVIATARSEEKARAACAALSAEVVPLACDLAVPSSIRAAVRAVKDKGWRLDALIATPESWRCPSSNRPSATSCSSSPITSVTSCS